MVDRAFISLRNVSFRLGTGLVFENTNWMVGRRQHWALTGPNGSGKSLLAEALMGHHPAIGGELRYHFRPPAGLQAEQAIGYVSFEQRKVDLGEVLAQSRWNSFEEEGALTVGDLLSYQRVMEINPFEVLDGDVAARRAYARRLHRAVSLLRIEPFLERTLISLSNGETQRVELAKALCRPLRLLILDEPYAGLDIETRGYVARVLEHIMQSSLRVMILTTRLEDLPKRITHAAFVNHCRLLSAGPARQVLAGKDLRRSMAAGEARRVSARPRRAENEKKAKHPGRELVRFTDVTVRYGQRVVLDRFNWTIRSGESWALLGPNGSGKSTVLSLIPGDNPQAYANQVVVFGHQRGTGESIWDLKRRVGWLSPELQLHFNGELTCFEVVGSGLHETMGLFEPLTARQQRATRDCLRQFDLVNHAGRPLMELSPGEQRVVLLARALVKTPELLILDEPCLGLDAAHRRLVVESIDRLMRRSELTVICATHRTDEIPPGVSRVLRLGTKGRAIEIN